MVRGDDLYASGIVLVTPAGAGGAGGGRARPGPGDGPRRPDQGVRARRSRSRSSARDNPTFFSGETDLRGVFVAEGVRGQVDGRGPQGRRTSTPSTAAPPPSARPPAPRQRPGRCREAGQADASSPTSSRTSGARTALTRSPAPASRGALQEPGPGREGEIRLLMRMHFTGPDKTGTGSESSRCLSPFCQGDLSAGRSVEGGRAFSIPPSTAVLHREATAGTEPDEGKESEVPQTCAENPRGILPTSGVVPRIPLEGRRIPTTTGRGRRAG